MLALSLTAASCTHDRAPDVDRRPRVPSAAPSEDAGPPTLGEAVSRVRGTWETYDALATGAIVLVRVGDRTQVLASGLADASRQQPMRRDHRFPIQSITKTMVATVVLQLVAERELALDDTVEDVLPGLLPQGRRITIRHLLSHRAGLYDAVDADLPPLGRITRDTLVEIAADRPLEFRPGSSGHYSNAGYEVLGRVVEAVTRQRLSAVLAQRVFGPAHMSDSALLGSADVHGHVESRVVGDPYFRFLPAAGGVVSTVRDIDRFFTALWEGELLDTRFVDVMTEPRGVIVPMGRDYGLGVWFHPASCGRAMGHSGAALGFATRAWTLTGTARSVVVMVNDGDGQDVADSLAAAALCP